MKRFALLTVLLTWAIGCGLFTGSSAAAPTTRPNILLIVVDDLGYGELGCQGNPQIPTPHIDSIADRGVRFTQGYVTASFCSPSRAGLLTGRYQARFGHESNPVGAANLTEAAGMALTERTMADHLRAAGYRTGLVGKWHLGALPQFHPQRRGFDEFFGFLHEGHFYVPGPPWEGVTTWLRVAELPAGMTRQIDGTVIRSSHLKSNEPKYDQDNPILRGEQIVTEADYLTDAWSREAAAFLERPADRPFFLYLSYNAPHSPMQARQDDLQKRFANVDDIHRRLFAAMVARLDDGIGRVLELLRQRGQFDNTLIFLISDNGGPTAELTSSNLPLRGGKGTLYEGGIRVPFLVQWPARIAGGQVIHDPVISLDILPTMLAAAEAKPETTSQTPLDGINLLPRLEGQTTRLPDRPFFWRMNRHAALRQGDWKIVRHGNRDNRAADFELFHVADDPSEQHDLASQHADQLAALRKQFERLSVVMSK